MADYEEKNPGAGLWASIFIAPQIFGWLVFRPGYATMTRILVALYMLVTAIPLWFLVATLWNSSDQIQTMAQDFNRNRAVADRNAGEARGYMRDYESGDLGSGRAPTGGSGVPDPSGAISVDAAELARNAEKGAAAMAPLAGHAITVTGRATGTSAGDTVYLAGTEMYPAVSLHYATPSATISAGDVVTATCGAIGMATAGPTLSSCR